MTTDTKDPKNDYNIFRHSLLRYAGYANEVGESFRYQYPRLVGPSYVVAFGYCLADAGYTGYRAYTTDTSQEERLSVDSNSNSGEDHQHRLHIHKTIRATMDTLLWQSLASVALPGMTINLLVKASRSAVRRISLPLVVVEWLPTFVGLGSIPFIVHPIDQGVDYVMDRSIRQWW
jgi:fission process protein 1